VVGTANGAKVTPPPSREEAAAPPKESRLLDHCRAAFAGGRIRDARAACASAASADPKSAEAHVILAHAELNLGRSRQALDHARKAVNLDGGLADAYVIIGGVQQELGNAKEAKTAYLRYLELAPGGRYADDLRAIVQSL
jgi:tetratricopeptide (TPR) repeat protein